MDAEALHHPEGPRDPAVGHVPQGVMRGFGVERDEVPERVVRALRLRDLPVGVRLAGVDDVGELDGVLDEEDRDVVADQVEGAFLGVELRREPAGVTHRVRRAARAEDGGEPDEHGCLHVLREEGGTRHLACGSIALEDPVRGGSARVHHSFRDSLVVEMRDLLAQMVVLEKHRPSWSSLQRVIGVVEPCPLGGGEVGTALRHACLLRTGGLPSGAHGLRPFLVRFGRERLRGLRQLDHAWGHRPRLARHAVLVRLRGGRAVLRCHRLSPKSGLLNLSHDRDAPAPKQRPASAHPPQRRSGHLPRQQNGGACPPASYRPARRKEPGGAPPRGG